MGLEPPRGAYWYGGKKNSRIGPTLWCIPFGLTIARSWCVVLHILVISLARRNLSMIRSPRLLNSFCEFDKDMPYSICSCTYRCHCLAGVLISRSSHFSVQPRRHIHFGLTISILAYSGRLLSGDCCGQLFE